MGNAHTHERRKSGVPETGLVIEGVRSSPALNVTAEGGEGSNATQSGSQAKGGNGAGTGSSAPTGGRMNKTPPPSFEADAARGRQKGEDTGFRPRAATTSGAPGAGKERTNNNRKVGTSQLPDGSAEGGPLSDLGGLAVPDDDLGHSADSSENVGAKGLPTIFKYNGQAKEVYVCGTFSQWKKIPMVKSQKDFVALIDLPVGEHQYKFFVDNNWTHDPNLPAVRNEMGTKNNLIKIQQDDFDAFSALDMDSKSTRQKRGASSNADAEFGQDIPGLPSFENKPGPPILPPHLLQVILNKDTPLSCEPTLLPEPNHVMINHLYALSIKDGVMVISSTQRYRKKYVTTLLYKPIDGAA